MDGIDRAILEELKRHGRVSASEISKNVNLSVPAVAERIRTMEGAGVIRGYTALLDRRKTGAGLLAFVFVNLDRTEHVDAFRREAVLFPCVMECHHTAGVYDYLLKVALEDTAALERFLTDGLKRIPGVAATNTIITLATLKEAPNP